jgi:ipoprotein LpqH
MTTPTGRRMKEGNPVKRLLAAAIGTLGCASALVACSSGGHTAGPASSTGPSAAGSGAQVQVGGSNLPGLNPASVTCVKQGGKIDIGSGSTGGQQALAVVMTDGTTPKVESLALVVDGNALSVSNNLGAKVGSANDSRSGSAAVSGPADRAGRSRRSHAGSSCAAGRDLPCSRRE